jgi:hypothetical protein
MQEQQGSALGDEFDRIIRSLTDLPDVVKTAPRTIIDVSFMLNLAQTFVVQTYRHRDKGDYILVQHIGRSGDGFRLILPPKVAATIARQRDSLTSKMRKKGAAQAVETRKAGKLQEVQPVRETAEDGKGNK